jgi:hypothetical protein
MAVQPMANTGNGKGRRLRSPSYPGITLEAALKLAKEFYNLEKRNTANIGVALQHWGFKPKSSGGLVSVAALKSFGLLSDTGSGKDRKVQLTELALRIILDTRAESLERQQAIKEAALRPTIHSALWNKYGTNLPSDENLRHELIFDRKFNENSVGDFIKEYRDTIKLAKLVETDSISAGSEDKLQIKVGDHIQWVSQGSDQFSEPLQVRELSEDGKFAFVNGSQTGIPIEQTIKCDAPIGEKETGERGAKITTIPTVLKRPTPKPGMRNDVFTLDEGEVILQWPDHMSPESYEDFEAWLDLIAKKAKRSVGKQEPDGK